MAERVAAAGYAALGKQTAGINTPVTPTIFTPYYKQSMETMLNLISDKPVYGSKFETFQMLQSTRSHKGALTVMAEPNTAGQWLDMLYTQLGTTGAGPYLHTFGLSTTADPNWYTLDISLVSQVVRFFGVGASKIAPTFSNEEMQFDVTASAIGSFYGREIASITVTGGSATIVFTTTYDPNPTTGLVAADLLWIKSPTGAYADISATLTSITNGTTIVVAASAFTSVATGDYVTLRPQSVSLSISQPFLWPLTNFYFASTAATAITNSASTINQLRLEEGSAVDWTHNFEKDTGSVRSGAFDPASLIRTVGGYTFKVKQYFDKTDQIKQWEAINKQACVMKCTSNSGYYLYQVMNNIKQTKETISTSFSDVIYQEEEYGPQYDTSDGQGMSIVLANGSPTI